MAETMTTTFWLIMPPERQRPLMRAAQPAYDETACPSTDRHAILKRVGDLHVIAHPLGLRDFTWTWPNDMLISPKVLALFERHRITGFDVRRAHAEYPKPIEAKPPELYEVIVTGWGGLPAREAGLSVAESCPACVRKVYALAEPSRLIDPTGWDGSDIFMLWPLPRHPFVSDRLASIIRQEKLSGVRLLPPQDIPIKRGTKLAPGSLFEWMPENRARRLIQRFGIW
jgi:hypothetical protein